MEPVRQLPKFVRFLFRFFKWYCKSERLEELHGDLEELYIDRLEEVGRTRALLHYAWDVVRCCQPYAWKKLEGQLNSNTGMLINFYLTALRSLRKHRSYFLINLSGLTIGITSFIFIALYIVNELSYDRFHANHKQIFRVENHAVIRGEANLSATTAGPMADMLLNDYSEVEQATRMVKVASMLVGDGDRTIVEEDVLFADSSFFKVLNFELLQGNPNDALKNPRSLVLTASYAKKYFNNENPIGRTLTINEGSEFYTVRGVVADPPPNSHIQFNMMGSILSNKAWNQNRWVSAAQYCYIRLAPNSSVPDFESRIRTIFYDHMAKEIEYFTGLDIEDWEEAGNRVDFKLNPIADIHLKSHSDRELETGGNITYIYIYGLIAMMSLAIAIFNFINLATAHAANRGKEVGVRKVMGSSRRMIVYQFIFEAVMLSVFATVLAVGLVQSFKGLFFDLIGKPLTYDLFSHFSVGLILLGMALLIGLLSGLYPAFALSRFTPMNAIKGADKAGKKQGIRSLLVVFQFVCSIVIIIGASVVYGQLNFMLSKDLGFDQHQVMVIKKPSWLGDDYQNFKQTLLAHPNVQQVSRSQTVPGKSYDIRSYRRKGDNETFLFLNNQIQYDHQEVFGFELVQGRFFSKDFPSDSNAVVINETAASKFGFEDPIGQQLTSAFKKDRPLTIIGVMKNYHVQSLHQQMAPMSLELSELADSQYINVKLSHVTDLEETLGFIDQSWGEFAREKPLQYFFMNEDFRNLYQAESSTGRILLVFAGLTVFIACMGLIGLMTYITSARQKEIGIRKVLGAGIARLLGLLSVGVIRLVVIATLIAWPLAWWASTSWLEAFADRISPNLFSYVGATGTVLAFVSGAIIWQILRAARSNPVDSLRDE
ncbi:MAG: ABC transporter permease [Cytophagales bacterium]|nr:ABC transporter permease [Cytophagales bacterium]